METKREEIIRRAVFEKLANGINIYTAEDILTVAGITEEQLQKIADSVCVTNSKPDLIKEVSF